MIHFKIKLVTKTLLLFIFSILFCQNLKVFSQNISFEELIYLQKEKKKEVNTFLTEKAWKQDAKLDYIWSFGNNLNIAFSDEMLVLRDVNCNKNIIYYSMNDSLKYKALKESLLKGSDKHNIIKDQNFQINDYYIKELCVRFYETNYANQLPLYVIWIFSNSDSWYFGELNKYCFKNIIIDTNEKPIRLTWYCDKDGIKPSYRDPNDTIRNVSPPEFPGGDFKRINYMEKNIRFPYSKHGQYNKIYTCIVNIEKDGSISDVKIPLENDDEFDVDVINVIKTMPRWFPALENGKPVRVELYMPIWFKPNKDIRIYNTKAFMPIITPENN